MYCYPSQNISEPRLPIGVVTMPLAFTSLDEVLGSVAGVTGIGGNESQETIAARMLDMIAASPRSIS